MLKPEVAGGKLQTMTAEPGTDEPRADEQIHARWAVADWLGKVIVDRDGEGSGSCRTSM
jgi:hypothetical protein